MTLLPIPRRTFLRATGVAIGLPMLEAMLPGGRAQARMADQTPRRTVLIGQPLGMYGPNFFPEQPGPDYVPSRYLKQLESHRQRMTVISGMSHRYAAGHYAEVGLFTGVAPEFIREKSIKNGISLDQEIAAHIGNKTRFSSLILGGGDVAWNRRGVRLPAETRAAQVFRKLFIAGSPAQQAQEIQRLQNGKASWMTFAIRSNRSIGESPQMIASAWTTICHRFVKLSNPWRKMNCGARLPSHKSPWPRLPTNSAALS